MEKPEEPWMSIQEACKRLKCSRTTIWRLTVPGILVRVFDKLLTKGVTVKSVEAYEAALHYREQRERGEVDAMPWASKDRSPLDHIKVTGRYPSKVS